MLIIPGKNVSRKSNAKKIKQMGSIYKLYINRVYLLLRDAKLLLRDSIYKLKVNTSFFRDSMLAIALCIDDVTNFWSLL